jgi:hypothetical protein
MRFRVLLCLFLSALGAGTVQAQVLKLAANERLAEQFVASRLLKAIYTRRRPEPADRAHAGGARQPGDRAGACATARWPALPPTASATPS